MPHDDLPDLEELARRLRAARVLANLTPAELSARCHPRARLGERQIRRLEAGEAQLTPPILRELCEALRFPYEWFTTPDLAAAVAQRDPGTAARLVQVEDALEAMQASQTALWEWAQGLAPAGGVRHSPPPTAPGSAAPAETQPAGRRR
jgi:transcriptional regulator with XRE-family HTH domain